MPGNALAVAAELPALIVPSPQAMEDDHLVPERALGIDHGYVRNGKVDPRHICINIRGDHPARVRIKRRLGARLDLHRLADVSVGLGSAGIDQQQGLAILWVWFHTQVVGKSWRISLSGALTVAR